MKKISKKQIIFSAGSLVLITSMVLGITFYRSNKVTDAEEAATDETVIVSRQNLKKTLCLTGTIAAADSCSVTSDIIDTTVKKVCVKVGDRVKKDDVIAELDPLGMQQALDLANSNLNLTLQKNALELEAAKRTYDNALSQAAEMETRKQQEESQAQTEAAEAKDKLKSTFEKREAVYAEQKTDHSDVNALKDQVDRLTDNSRRAEKNVSDSEEIYDEAVALRDKRRTELSSVTDSYEEAAATGDGTVSPSLQNQYDEAKRALEDAEQQVANAKEELDRAKDNRTNTSNRLEDTNKKLTDQQSDLDETKSKKSEADTLYETAKTDLKTAETNEQTARYGLLDLQRENAKTIAESKDAIESALLAGTTSELTARQEVEKAQAMLDKCTIKAPADGVVVSVDVKEGEAYKGTQIAMISDDSGYKVQAVADQYDIGDITKGLKVRVETQAAGDEVMKGYLSFVSPIPLSQTPSVESADSQAVQTASQKNNGYAIEAAIHNPSDRIRIGMNAKLTIVIDSAKDVLALPDNAIQVDENGEDYVEVMKSDSEATERIPVRRGLKTDYYVEVEGEGLTEGMSVVQPAGMDEFGMEDDMEDF